MNGPEPNLTEIEIVSKHYLEIAGSENHWGDWGQRSSWKCPECANLSYKIDPQKQTAGCGFECRVPAGLGVYGVVAYLGGLDPRTQQREINREYGTILKVHELRRATEAEERVQYDRALQEIELERCEEQYTLEEREAAINRLRSEQANWRPLEERAKEAADRNGRTVRWIMKAHSLITGHEAVWVAIRWTLILFAVYYGIGWLQDFSQYTPLPDGLGISTEGSRQDNFLQAELRDVVARLPLDWLMVSRLPLGFLIGGIVAVWRWQEQSSLRRRDAAPPDDEYVGVYTLLEEGEVRWRDDV